MPTTTTLLRVGNAAVWLVLGVGFKLLDLVPRHREIVGAIVGEGRARPVTLLVGGAEAVLGIWTLTGRWPRCCAGVQIAAVVTMNALELAFARDLLLAPIAMPWANGVLLAMAWRVALARAAPTGVA